MGAFSLPALSNEERFAALAIIQPEIERVLEEALSSAQGLEPPGELQADHDVVVRYLEETLDTARAITRATQERDVPAQREQFIRSGTVFCDAEQALSPAARSIVSVLFGDEIAEECR